MGTNRPRIYLTPEPDTLAAIDRIAMFRGVPRSTVAAEYLNLIAPALSQLGDALAEAHSAAEDARETIGDLIDYAHDPVIRVCQETAQAMRDGPPSSNTGVTTSGDSPHSPASGS